MTFEETMRAIAKIAAKSSTNAMKNLGTGRVKHEDDLTGVLVGELNASLKSARTGGVKWDAAIMTHRKAGEEGKVGADLLIHVELNTPQHKYSKGVLVQAKRIGPGENITSAHHLDLKKQCGKMLAVTSSSFVFAYDTRGMRAGSATKVEGSSDRAVYDQCSWTAYRFFLELFRCPVGDPNITSADFHELALKHGIAVTGNGTLEPDRFIQD